MLRALATRLGTAALIGGLAVVAVPDTPASTAAEYKPWGTAVSTNKVLRPRCHNYPFRYRVDPPSNDWAAEIFLSNPNGRGIASKALLSGEDAATGRRAWRLCRASLSYGRYKIRMKITYRESAFTTRVGWVRPTFFRMVRPPNR